MEIICKPRQGGKTTELIEKAKDLSGYNLIVCINKVEATRIWKIIREKEYSGFNKKIIALLEKKNSDCCVCCIDRPFNIPNTFLYPAPNNCAALFFQNRQ